MQILTLAPHHLKSRLIIPESLAEFIKSVFVRKTSRRSNSITRWNASKSVPVVVFSSTSTVEVKPTWTIY